MSTTFQTKLHNFLYRNRYRNRNFGPNYKNIVIVVLVILLLTVLSSTTLKSIVEALTPPNLPELQVVNNEGKWLKQYWPDQNWGGTQNKVSEDTRKYHHISQGTATLQVPYSWFIHLERPDSSIWSFLLKNLLFIKTGGFSDNEYLLRFGFIRSEPHPVFNPDGLPIGFAKSPSLKFPGYTTKTEGIGFSCPACHTGHFVYGEGDAATEYIIEGAPATTDLGQLTAALGATLGQTVLSSKIPFFDGRFDRFARNVLGTQYNAQSKLALAENLGNVITELQKVADIVEVQEGFSRLDALNRIGNQVFSKNVGIRKNYQPIDAPVNYPHLWTAPWFKWVQYDASIMRPLVRNAGEAMGVNAKISMTSPKNHNRYDSSIPMANLVWIEDFLKGEQFNEGLTAPSWFLTKINTADATYIQGKTLYEQRCQSCHLPVIGDAGLAKYFSPIKFLQNGKWKSTKEKVLDLKIIPEKQIGTDPAQANVLVTRTINTAGKANGPIVQIEDGLGIDKAVCGQNPVQIYENQLFGENNAVDLIDNVEVKDGGEINFGLALGAMVQQTIDAWFVENGITDTKLIDAFEGGRPNCLQEGNGYKARPLNGVWATAPFLHNGSVATIRDLICLSADQRPNFVQLGNIDFDPVNVGLKQPENFAEEAAEYKDNNQLYTDDGFFILDTSIAGNSNSGHSFSDAYDTNKHYSKQDKGVIGPKFNDDECNAILTYIKSI